MLVLALALASCDGVVGGVTEDAGAAADAVVADLAGGDGAGLEPCDGYDNDQDGVIDEGCTCKKGATAKCYPGPPGLVGKGICSQGTFTCHGTTEFGVWGDCTGAVTPRPEVCGNGVDEDCDGKDRPRPSDAGVAKEAGGDAKPACTPNQTKACYSGKPGTAGVGPCKNGLLTCLPGGTWSGCVGEVTPKVETCGNGVDEDCDGKDPACPPKKVLFGPFFKDCAYVSCPKSDPYPVGCQVIFSPAPKEPRGCVASTPSNSTVYFKAGDSCSAGFVTGFLLCSKTQGAGLNLQNCPMIGKTKFYYVASPSQCPQ